MQGESIWYDESGRGGSEECEVKGHADLAPRKNNFALVQECASLCLEHGTTHDAGEN